MRKLIYFTVILFLFASCGTEPKKETKKDKVSYKEVLKKMESNDVQVAKAIEAINSGSYTYVLLSENGKEFWAAVSAQPIKIGANYYYKDALEMKNFQSKSLNKVFESILFINEFYAEKSDPGNNPHVQNNKPGSENIKQTKIEAPAGGYSLADIFKKKTDLKDQEIIVKGQVVKINLNIMKTNWIHIQDGTSYQGVFDLTITTKDEINFHLGDIITFKGTLHLNKDFGAGYRYDYIIENASWN